MKNLANCTPEEFLRQTFKIKGSVEKWLDVTKIGEIRRRKANISDEATKEERLTAVRKQAKENLSAMLDAALKEHPAETLELLALLCFVEPADVNNHTMSEYIGCVGELLDDRNVLSFLSSLMRLEQKVTPEASAR